MPERLAAPWLGAESASRPATQIALRGLAARDGALAAAIVVAHNPCPWLLLCALGDAADLTATLPAPPSELPPNSRRGTMVLAGSSALLALALRRHP